MRNEQTMAEKVSTGQLQLTKFFSSADYNIFWMYIVRSRWVWSCYPWAIREIQDGDQCD